MPKKISFDTGLEEYDINGASVWFNPTDMAFVERVFNLFNAMDAMSEEYNAKMDSVVDPDGLFTVYHEMEAKMRGMIDDVFGEPGVSELIFPGNNSVFGLSGGLPKWANLMLAIIDEMDASFAREKKLTNPRLKKYTDKYRTRAGK